LDFIARFAPQAVHFKIIILFSFIILVSGLLQSKQIKLGYFIGYLEPVISPNAQSTHSMIEVNNLDDKTKDDMFIFYKKMQHIHHVFCLKDMGTQKDVANFINDLWKQWPDIKQKEIKFLKLINETWLKQDQQNKGNFQ